MKAAAAIIAFVAAGCTVGPDYHAPKTEMPGSFSRLPAAQQAPMLTPTAAEADLSRWWERFGDSELQNLITRALKSNLDLLTAASRVREAREAEVAAGAAEWPQLDASGRAINFHGNGNPLAALAGPPGGAGGSGAVKRGTNIKLYSAGFDASWELDIFGGTRRGIEAARANTEAAVWQMRDGEVSVTAEIAADYLSLRSAQARLAVLRTEAQRQNDTLSLVSSRHQAGFVTELDVDQQNMLHASTTAQIAPLEAEVAAMEHALAVLAGEQPEALSRELDAAAPLPSMPWAVAAGLPSDLLRRRPDVREAERKLAAATAGIGVAVADLYPKFDLSAMPSFAGSHLSGLISNGNLGELLMGTITWPIFHGGQIRANIHSKEEERQQAYYAYQKAVLGAVQDTENALVRVTTDQSRVAALDRAANAGQSSVTIANQQYQVGLVNYVNVLTAETSYLSARDQLEQARLAFATDVVSLYKALGGGWSDAPMPDHRLVEVH